MVIWEWLSREIPFCFYPIVVKVRKYFDYCLVFLDWAFP